MPTCHLHFDNSTIVYNFIGMFPSQLLLQLLTSTCDHVYHPDLLRICCVLTDGDRLGCRRVRQPMDCSSASVKQLGDRHHLSTHTPIRKGKFICQTFINKTTEVGLAFCRYIA